MTDQNGNSKELVEVVEKKEEISNKATENANPPAVRVEDQLAANNNSKDHQVVAVNIDQQNIKKANMSADQKPSQGKLLAGLSTILTFILSLPVLASVVWLFYMRNYECESLLRLPKLQFGIGIGLIAVFVISNGFVFLRARFPMPGLLVAMVPLLVMLTMGLALVGAYKMESKTIVGSPVWLKSKIFANDIWNDIETCLYDNGACKDFVSRSLTLKSYSFPSAKLSYLEVITIFFFFLPYTT